MEFLPDLSRLQPGFSEGFSVAGHVFHEIYLHLNWHTKNDEPMLVPEIERKVHELIRRRCASLKGVYFQGIGGTENHVHLVVRIEPFVLISNMVQVLKGGSSHEINDTLRRKALLWQRGYAVVSFAKRHLKWVLDYVSDQKEHHARNSTNKILEECGFFTNLSWSGEKPG